MQRLSGLDWLCLILTIIGGINWGLIGFFNYDLVDAVFAGTLARIIYAVVGLSALYLAFLSPRLAKKLGPGEKPGVPSSQEKMTAAR
ncbi:MAG: DUF378 domain-containing protein [Deltaproteobacteria bacterium]